MRLVLLDVAPANGRGEELIAPNDSGRHGALSAGTRDGHSGQLDTLDTEHEGCFCCPHHKQELFTHTN